MTHLDRGQLSTPSAPKATRRSREDIAKEEIGRTDSTNRINLFLVLVFCVIIASVPISQNIIELRGIREGREPERNLPQSWDVFSSLSPTSEEIRSIAQAESMVGYWDATLALNRRIIRDIQSYETELKDRDTVVKWLIPRVQTVITGVLRGGNEDAYCGRDGWLFYRRDVDSLTGHGFLDPKVLSRRTSSNEIDGSTQPDPVKAIIDFRDQLAARGIALIVLPAPVKPSIYPEAFSSRYQGQSIAVHNPSYELFLHRLTQGGIHIFDPAPLLLEAKVDFSDTPLYLKTDTHWTPAGLSLVAKKLAEFIRGKVELPSLVSNRFKTIEKSVTNLGDVARMLNLPDGQQSFPPETVTINQVVDDKGFWRPDPNAQVLFLGDSFTNIYSLEPMGWGESAGFAEHLSLSLGLSLDTICRNDAGSFATREMLAADLRRGHDRLAGKKVVIWEFASRELTSGNWKMLPLVLGEKKDVGFYAPKSGKSVAIQGTVRGVSSVPRPGGVPYKDHIFLLHLTDLRSDEDPDANGKSAAVYVWSMRDNKTTATARCRIGDSISLFLKPWSDVSKKYDSINNSGSELDDPELLLAEPAWGETERARQ